MKKLLLIFISIISISFAKFSLSNANSDEFPKIKFSFSATTLGGTPLENIQASEFDIIENGINVNETVEVLCNTSDELQEASILLILDQSISMRPSVDDPTNRWEWVVEGARSFIEAVEFEGRTELAMTKFGKTTQLVHPFTNQRQSLIDALEDTQPNGTATFYNPTFLDDDFGAIKLLSEQPDDVKRVVVFLTDGLPDIAEDNKWDEIIDELNNFGISCYTITLQMPMTPQLAKLANDTGGQDFQVYDRDRLSEIYQLIALDIQEVQLCELSYIAPYGCDENSRNREVSVDFERDTDDGVKIRNYFAPEESIAQFDFSTELVSFGNPEINTSSLSSVTITNSTAPLQIDNIEIIPAAFFDFLDFKIDGADAAFGDLAPPGSIIELNLRFTQGATKDFRQAALNIVGDFCGPTIDLVGGFANVVLISPEEVDTYSACETILIEWAGVDPSTPVKLFYQRQGDPSWFPINNGANLIGGSYRWTPPSEGFYKIRVQREEQNLYLWSEQGSSMGNAISSGIDLSPDENFIYLSGYFEDQLFLKGESLNSINPHDIFYAKLDRDGNYEWMFDIRGPGDDSSSGIEVLPNGDVLLCGTVEKGADFRPFFPNIQFEDLSYAFIAKINPEGVIQSVTVFGATGTNINTQAWSTGVRYDEAAGRIELVGFYRGRMEIGNIKELNYPQNSNNPFPFIIYLDEDLDPITGFNQGFNLNEYEIYSIVDSEGDRFETAHFSEDNNPFGFISMGNADFYVSRFGSIGESIDENTDFFEVEKPILQFEQTEIDLGSVLLGESSSRLIPGLLTNPGDLPIDLNPGAFDNLQVDEFALSSQIPNQILAGQSIAIEFLFSPKDVGMRTGTFRIDGTCTDEVSIDLVGNGFCRGESLESIDLGSAITNITKDVTIEDAFTNPTNATISITPTVIDDPDDQFAVFVDNNGTKVASINVPPYESVNLIFEFTPINAGVQTARVDYGVQDLCENTFSDVTGEGINSSVVVNAIDIENRIQTVNRRTLTMSNLSSLPVTITDLSLVGNNDIFEIINLDLPIIIDGEGQATVDYEFHPQVEGIFETTVNLLTEDGSSNNSTVIIGRATNPRLEVTFDCPPQETIQGETGVGTLTLRNLSSLESVESIDIASLVAEFLFDGGLDQVGGNVIQPDGELELNINFTPITNAPVASDFNIIADVAVGNNIDDTYDPTVSNDYSFEACPVEASDNTTQINFGNILICDKPGEQFIRVSNPSATPLIINSADISFTNNSGVFNFELPNDPLVLDNIGDEELIRINFTPTSTGLYDEILTINNNKGIGLVYELTGTGVELVLDMEVRDEIAPSNNEVFDNIILKASLPQLANGDADWNIENLRIRVYYDQGTVSIQETIENIQTTDFDWIIEFQDGYLDLVGTGNLATPFNLDVLEMIYTVFLSDRLEVDLTYEVINNCPTTTYGPTTLNVAEFCGNRFRLIGSTGSFLSIDGPNPNPIKSSTYIGYSIPFDSNVNLELIDVNGNSVLTLEENYLSHGYHQSFLDIKDISSGVYILQLKTNRFIETKRVLIAK